MAPQKRSASETDAAPLKRAKTTAKNADGVTPSNEDDEYKRKLDAITYENTYVPSLLRLPAELRNQIWKYAFGNVVLHINSEHKRGIAPTVCQSLHSAQDLYDLTLRGATTYDPHRYAAPELAQPIYFGYLAASRFGTPEDEHCSALCDMSFKWFYIPLVCKQVLNEAIPIVYSTCTFHFSHYTTFRDFADQRPASAEKIQNLVIRMPNTAAWDQVRFDHAYKALRHVTIVTHSVRHLHAPIAKHFQQFNLKDAKVIINQDPSFEPQRMTIAQIRKRAEDFRKEMLRHQPRRKSGRVSSNLTD